MIADKEVILSKKGYKELEEKLNYLKDVKRHEIASKISTLEYELIDCFNKKCTKESDYIGYLLFLKDKINSFQKEIK